MLENAQLVQSGAEPQFQSIPRNHKECTFGKWFYSDGQKLKALSNNPMECIQNIELLHSEFHRIYYDIIELYESKNNSGLIGKLFSKKELSDEQKQRLHTLTEELQNVHEKLLAEINKMQRRIQATPQEKFDNLQ